MASEVVRQGKAAWSRLKQGSGTWSDWVLVGHALIEGRTVAMRHAGTTIPAGRGYSDAFGDWLLSNHLNVPAPARAKLLVLMANLAEIEQWRPDPDTDTAAAHEPSGRRAEELLASDRDQAASRARQPGHSRLALLPDPIMPIPVAHENSHLAVAHQRC
jgi:hypothetical protein